MNSVMNFRVGETYGQGAAPLLVGTGRRSWAQRAEAAAIVAAEHANEVDLAGRFPAESLAVFRTQRLLGMAVPTIYGGEGASTADVADVCFKLGRACSSSAMIFAMHQIKVACIVRHKGESAWHRDMLGRLCDEQWLLASSTTEGQNGGNIRTSAAALDRRGDTLSLDRESTVISYGAQADGIVTTMRRSADASGSDQVLVVLLRDQYDLEPLVRWDTLGMRGTCSAGFRLHAAAGAEQVLPVPYDTIHGQTMTPMAHILWSAAWSGIAAAAVDRTQAFLRKAARQSKGQMPPGAAHFTKAQSSLRSLMALVRAAIVRFEAASADPHLMTSLDFHAAMNLLKVEASEAALGIVMAAMRACGLSGYRNDSECSLGRQLRDVLSGPLMINNDRILASLATTSLMSSLPTSLMD